MILPSGGGARRRYRPSHAHGSLAQRGVPSLSRSAGLAQPSERAKQMGLEDASDDLTKWGRCSPEVPIKAARDRVDPLPLAPRAGMGHTLPRQLGCL